MCYDTENIEEVIIEEIGDIDQQIKTKEECDEEKNIAKRHW